MAKSLPDAIKNIFAQATGANVDALDPSNADGSPIEWRYTSYEIFHDRLLTTSILGKLEEEAKATKLAKTHALALSRVGVPGAAAPPGTPAAASAMEKLLAVGFEAAILPFGLGFLLGAGETVVEVPTVEDLGTLGGYLNGVFSVLDVPFSVGELKPPSGVPKTFYERYYTPSFAMRVRTEAAIIESGYATLADAFGLKAGTSTPWKLNLGVNGWGFGGKLLRDMPLRDAITALNAISAHKMGGLPGTPGSRASLWRHDIPQDPGTTAKWLLRPIAPTRDEWENPQGAYKWIGRGGFLIDHQRATGVIQLEARQWNGYGGMEAFAASDRFACAAWVRDTGSTSKFPDGLPHCVAPVTLQTPDIDGWETYVSVLEYPTFWMKLIPHSRTRSTYDQTRDTLVSTLDNLVRNLCDNDETAYKATMALIAFAQLQGKSAQEAKAKAKTDAEKANAAALAKQYQSMAAEIQLAVTAANAWCKVHPIPVELLPATDLPGVEPPVHPKFNIQHLLDEIKLVGPGSLSPDQAASPTRWSTSALVALGLLGAAGGALAYRRKHPGS